MRSQNRITRRRLLRSTLRAGGGIALGPLLARTGFGAATFSPPLAVFSKLYQELRLDFDQSADVTAEAGLDGIDCPVRPGGQIEPEHAAEQMPRYAEALRRRGVRMLLLTTAIQGVSSPNADQILRNAKQMGIQYYRLGYWSHRPDERAGKLLSGIRSHLKDLAAMNKELGVCGVYQNHSAGKDRSRRNAGCDLAELYRIVEGFNPDQIGVAFDLGHAIIEHGDKWREHFEKLRSHIRLIYIKDVRRPSTFVPFGQGDFQNFGFFGLLRQMNYQAPLSIHVEYNWSPAAPKTRVGMVKMLRENRRVVEQWIADSAR